MSQNVTNTWTPNLTTNYQNQQHLEQTDFMRDTQQTNFNYRHEVQQLPMEQLKHMNTVSQLDKLSAHSLNSNVNPNTLNFQLKQQIRDLKQLQQEIIKKQNNQIEQQCMQFIQKSFDQVKDYVQIQAFNKLKEFTTSREIIQFKSSSHKTEEALIQLQKTIDNSVGEAQQVVLYGSEQKKEIMFKEIQDIQAQCFEFLDNYEPIELEFDFNNFKQDLDFILHKYIKIKFNSGNNQILQSMRSIQNKNPETIINKQIQQQTVNRQNYHQTQNNQPQPHQPQIQTQQLPRANFQGTKSNDISPIRKVDQKEQDQLQQREQYDDNHLNDRFYQELESQYDQDPYIDNSPQQDIKMTQKQQQFSPQPQYLNNPSNTWEYQLQPQSNKQGQNQFQKTQQNYTLQNPRQNQPIVQQSPQPPLYQTQAQKQPQIQPISSPPTKQYKSFIDEYGNIYQGEVVNETVKDGEGEVKYQNDGSYYKGSFKNGMRNGRGQLIMQNGDKYVGEWSNDMKHGYGKIEFVSSGIVYYGQWACDKMHGIGTMSGPNNYFYNGEWKHGKQNGKGNRKYDDKSTYEGNFENELRNGQGKIVYKDGSVYEGMWKNDKKNGLGIFTFTDGSILRANWIDDLIQGKGELEKGNGKIMTGEWNDNQLVKVISEK